MAAFADRIAITLRGIIAAKMPGGSKTEAGQARLHRRPCKLLTIFRCVASR